MNNDTSWMKEDEEEEEDEDHEDKEEDKDEDGRGLGMIAKLLVARFTVFKKKVVTDRRTDGPMD